MRIVQAGFEIEQEIDGPAVLKRIERAGRTCYKSEDRITEDSASKFVRTLIASGHESVLEHEKITVRVVCDRGVSHEIVRHRIASYSQESTRYCDYAKAGEIQVIEPPGLGGNWSHWFLAMQCCEVAYKRLRASSVSPQIARSVLPNALKTEIVITMNLREWRHFFRLRTAPAAHPQMREIAVPMLRTFQRLIPVVFEDIQPATKAA
jgi:thymidylate synthase (FAD)